MEGIRRRIGESIIQPKRTPSRFMRAGVVSLLLVSALVLLPAFATPARAVCRSRVATILFHVWGTAGSIVFAGASYADGMSTSISWGCGQSYSISDSWTATGFTFRQWASDAGSFANQAGQSTTFYPAGNSGAIAMVLQYGGPNNWGGYVADIASAPQGTTSWSAYATFVLPNSVSYVQAPNSGIDKVLVWSGLGGCTGAFPPPCGTNLWQAGFLLTVASGGAVTVHPFTDECTPTNCQPAYVWNGLFNTINIALGDKVYVQVSYATSSGPSFYMQDLGPGYTWTLQGPCPGNCIANYVPDTESSEWIVEAPTALASGSDCGVQQGYLCVLPNYGTFTIPNNSFGTTPLSADFALGLLRSIGDDSHQPTSDYSNPSYLTNGPISNSGGWSVVWGTAPG